MQYIVYKINVWLFILRGDSHQKNEDIPWNDSICGSSTFKQFADRYSVFVIPQADRRNKFRNNPSLSDILYTPYDGCFFVAQYQDGRRQLFRTDVLVHSGVHWGAVWCTRYALFSALYGFGDLPWPEHRICQTDFYDDQFS